MSDIQLLIVGAIVVLTILSTVIGIQVSLLFRDFKKVVERMDKVLTRLQTMGSSANENGQNESSHRFEVKEKLPERSLPMKRAKIVTSSIGRRFFKRKNG